MAKARRARVAFVTLIAFANMATGCAADATDETATAETAGTLEVKGASGNVTELEISQEAVDAVATNTDKLTIDGVETTDLALVLTAQKIETKVGDKAVTIVRDGNSLKIEGSTSGAMVNVAGAVFTAGGPDGNWECTLKGMSDETTKKLAGTMALAVLLSSEESLAADVEAGNCEIACVTVITIGIIVGIFIIAELVAFVVCQTSGKSICLKAAESDCGKGKTKSVNADCGSVFDFNIPNGTGSKKAKANCNYDCK